jgi:glycerol kinase
MPHVLALDQSTSATKALLFDVAGRCLDREAREHRPQYPQPGWVEHDAEEIWQNVLAVCRSLLARHPQIATDLVCLSVTNQRETVVVFSRATGRPLHPAIVWQCRRGDALCAGQAKAGYASSIQSRTGLLLDAYFSASKLQWLVRNQPALRTLLANGEALIGTIDTYLIYRLTEGKVFATDATNASRTLLYNIGRLCWDEELAALWEVPLAALAEVRESKAGFGETIIGGALARPIPICGVMGDSQASLFAQRCFQPGTAKVTFGTGSSVLLNLGSNLQLSERGVVTALAWVLDGVPLYAFEGIIINSAATLTWLHTQLGLVRDVREIESLAAGLADSGGVHFVPAFSGLGLPHWAPSARAAITGLSAHSDRRHVARAAVESMAYQLRDALEAMQEESGVSLRVLKADGGPTINNLLMQFTADITETELQVAGVPDCSALGATFMGLLGLGVHSSLGAIAALPHTDIVYRPAMPRAVAESHRNGWRRAVRQVLAGANLAGIPVSASTSLQRVPRAKIQSRVYPTL